MLIDGMMIMFKCHVQNSICLSVKMIVSSFFYVHHFWLIKSDKQPVWSSISRGLTTLKRKCDRESATVEDLKVIILKLSFYFNEQNFELGHD